MEKFFRDDIEVGAVDKFFCSEMRRQIHRYIKAMHGSRSSLEKFEENLHNLDIPQRERALAQYIDLNRQVVDMLDWRQLVARSFANYCDSYDYFKEMVTDLDTIDFYVQRMKEKYLRFHKVFEENGKFGIRNHDGDVVLSASYDFLRTPYVYVDDMRTMPVIAEKDGKMGLVYPDGKDTIMAPFIYDDIELREEEPWFVCKCGKKTTLL